MILETPHPNVLLDPVPKTSQLGLFWWYFRPSIGLTPTFSTGCSLLVLVIGESPLCEAQQGMIAGRTLPLLYERSEAGCLFARFLDIQRTTANTTPLHHLCPVEVYPAEGESLARL
jgi:hypothetical protein